MYRYTPFRRPGSRAVPIRSGLAVLAGLAACGAGGLAAGPAQAAAAGAAGAAANAGPFLKSVSADSPSDAWAVGWYGQQGVGSPPLIVHWNGKNWAKLPAPNPGGTSGQTQLYAVSATSPKDVWAVGSYKTNLSGVLSSLILHWNGTAWKQVPSPNPGASSGLTGLSAVHAISASDAWAAGDYEVPGGGFPTVPLIVHWDGHSWKQVASPGTSFGTTNVNGISADSANDIWTVGQYSVQPQDAPPILSLSMHSTGSSWKQVTAPSPGGTTTGVTYLNGVSAVSAKDVWAAGFSAPTANGPIRSLTLRWNGTSWKQVASPNPGGTTGSNFLEGVSAVSASSAWAVGFDATATGNFRSLILHWTGTSWKQVASPNPGGTTGNTSLEGVSAQSATNAWAVGYFGNSSGVQTLILHWNGTSWTKVTSPSLSTALPRQPRGRSPAAGKGSC